MEIQGKARVKESLAPISLFLAGILAFGLGTGFLAKSSYQRFPDAPSPVVTANSRKLVDECGVFMWVEWRTPRDSTIDREAPYVSMRERLKQKAARRINP